MGGEQTIHLSENTTYINKKTIIAIRGSLAEAMRPESLEGKGRGGVARAAAVLDNTKRFK